MLGIRLAIYFILTSAIFVFFCLYGCFVLIVNRFEMHSVYREDRVEQERKEQRKKVLVEGLTKIAKKYEAPKKKDNHGS